MQLTLTPIGIFSTMQKMRYQTALQPTTDGTSSGIITLNEHHNFEQALEGLIGFDRIWLIFWFDQNSNWRPKVLPPRHTKKVGVFATRSPHRPNPIGISCVRLEATTGRTLTISDHDLLDGTPILDVKPYIAYADAHPDASQGWLNEIPDEVSVEMTSDFIRRCHWILEHFQLDLIKEVLPIIKKKATPSPSNRIRSLGDNRFLLAFKTFRISYALDEASRQATLTTIISGYTAEALKESQEEEIVLHRAFMQAFPSPTT